MSTLDIASLSAKGQVSIPPAICASLSLRPGARLMIISDGDNILLKPMQAPKLAVFDRLIQESRSSARKAGLRQSDVVAAIRKARRAHRS